MTDLIADLQTNPKFIVFVGSAGSGKDTAARYVQEILGKDQVRTLVLAEPIKRLAGQVFEFTEDQLWGPSDCRNAPDLRYSFNQPKELGFFKKLYYRLLSKPIPQPRTVDQIMVERLVARQRLEENAIEWLADVLPEGVYKAHALIKLRDCFDLIMQNDDVSPRLVLQLLGTEFGRALDQDIWIKYLAKKAKAAQAEGFSVVVTDCRFCSEARYFSGVSATICRLTRLQSGAKGGVAGHQSEKEINGPEMGQFVDREIDNNKTLDDLRTTILNVLADG